MTERGVDRRRPTARRAERWAAAVFAVLFALVAGGFVPPVFGSLRPPPGQEVAHVPLVSNSFDFDGPVATADGPLSTAAVLVTLGRVAPRFTVDEVRDAVFGDHAEGSASKRLYDLSRGRVWLHGDVLGPVDVALGATPCDFLGWSQAARAQVGGLDQYDRVIFVFTGNVGCDPHGLADPSTHEIWILNLVDVATLVHEVLHTFNVGHAGWVGCAYRDGVAIDVRWWSGCTVLEYGDADDAMGHGPAELSGTNRAELGWLEPHEFATVEQTGSRELGCAGRRGGAPSVLRIPRGGGTWFDVEWRCEDGGGLLIRMGGLEDNTTAVVGMHSPDGDPNALRLNETFTDAVAGISITLAREGLPDGDVWEQSMATPERRAFVLVDLEGRGRAGGLPPPPAEIDAEVVGESSLLITWTPPQTDRDVGLVYDVQLEWPGGSGPIEHASLPNSHVGLAHVPRELVVEVQAIDAFGRRSPVAGASFAVEEGALVRTDR